MYFAVSDPDGNDVYPISPEGYESRWRCGKKRYDALLSEGLIEWKQIKDKEENTQTWKPYQKFYLEGRLKLPSNLWTELEGNKKATRELRDLLGDKVFDFPKPVDLVSHILQIGAAKGATVLDFFAGSGTTGHAVYALNDEDSGSRRFILVQLPEPLDPENKDESVSAAFCDKLKKPRNLAEITKERLRRVSDQYAASLAGKASDLGFRSFKLDSSNIHAWEPARDDIAKSLEEAVEHLRADRTEQDILFELLLKLGLDLTVPIETKQIAGKSVHSIGAGVLLACLDKKIGAKEVESLGHGIAEWHKKLAPAGESTIVFRDSAFADDVAKTNVTAILQQHGLENVRSL